MPETTHECPADGCTRRVRREQLACRNHWFRVSKATRERVWEAYRTGSGDHGDAIVQAITEMNSQRNPGGSPAGFGRTNPNGN